MLLFTLTHHVYLIFAVSWMQVLIDLEPIELKFIPKLLAFLVHDVRDTLVTVFFLLDVLVLLLFVIVVG